MRSLRLALALFPALALVACGGASNPGTGKVSVLLTDAPGDVKAAVVTITEIDLVGTGDPVVLSTTKVTESLLQLANNAASLVDGAVVPAGTYSQLRFVITGGYVEVEQADGSSIIYASSPTYEGLPEGATVGGELRMPSYGQSGLKVNLGTLQVGTEAKILLVDFDVAQSFGHDAGMSGAWVMHPVCTATELQLSGTLDVTLRLAQGVTLPGTATLGGFSATLTSPGGGKKVLPLTDAGAGTFSATFPFLIPGQYGLGLADPSLATTSYTMDPQVPTTVTILSGQPTTAAFVITATH